MTTTDTAVRLAGRVHLDHVAFLLAAAFQTGDYADWLIPDRQARRLIYPRYFRLLVEAAFEHGQIELTADGAAVAVWYRLSGPPLAPANYPRRLTGICGTHTPRFALLDAAFERHHPRDIRHDYLAFLAVRPQRQREGLGSLLLQHHHAQADAIGMPCYLEATGPGNSGLYQRHGYLRRDPYPVTTGGPLVYPMLRPTLPVATPTAAHGLALSPARLRRH